MAGTQVYEMVIDGRHHRVETSVGEGWSNTATWWVDGEEIATATSTTEDNLYLVVDERHDLADELGAVRARFTTLSKPLRATWFEGNRSAAQVAARVGAGGLDLVPEEGSPAAVREERMRAHPRLHAARHVVAGVAKVVIPLLLAALAARFVVSIPWPDWNLPSIPWPDWDLPAIPWPDWDLPNVEWEAPAWVRWVADRAKYVIPILVGLVIARREIVRRRHQDAERERRAAGVPSALASESSAVRDVASAEPDDAHDDEREPTQPRDE